jgi:uncharacterized membrane protein YfcA
LLWTVAAAILLAGLMGGLTGIGGVLVVPALTALAGVPVDRAVASSMLAFLVAGVPVAIIHLRNSPPRLRSLALTSVAAAIGAFAGAWTLDFLPPVAIRAFIALLAIASGLHALFRPDNVHKREIPDAVLAGLGLVVGYISAITGTGGPVTMIPALLWLGAAVRPAIAISVAAQLPITATASVTNFAAGRLDFSLALMVMAVLLTGTVIGAKLSMRLSSRALTVSVALVLIATGVWYGFTIRA